MFGIVTVLLDVLQHRIVSVDCVCSTVPLWHRSCQTSMQTRRSTLLLPVTLMLSCALGLPYSLHDISVLADSLKLSTASDSAFMLVTYLLPAWLCCSRACSTTKAWRLTPLHCCRFEPVVQASPSLVPDGFIYLRATPDICMGRMKRRSRQEEVGVQMEYLQGLHQKHEDWLRFPPPSPAVDFLNPSGKSLVEALRTSEHNLSVRAVSEPRAIQGKVRTICASCLHLSTQASPPPTRLPPPPISHTAVSWISEFMEEEGRGAGGGAAGKRWARRLCHEEMVPGCAKAQSGLLSE